MKAEDTKSVEEYQHQLEETKSAADFLDRLFNEISDAILIIDPQSYKILTFNQSALDRLGLSEPQLLGKTCYQLFYKRTTPCETTYKSCPVKEILNTSQPVLTDYDYTDKNNKLTSFEVSASPIKTKDRDIAQITFVMRDITQKKRAESREKNILELDEITGLYNQSYFLKQLKTEISRSQRHQRALSIVLVGIDNPALYRKMSLLNQHEFLAKTGKVIVNNIRDVDMVYRYGDYGLAIILPETNKEQALIFAKRLQQHYQEIIRGIDDINKLVIFSKFTLSLGIVEYTAPDEVETVVKKAEEALQQAQSKGNNICLWDQ
jgi:diguanylate cyclase (GGDEF)-like protein/PAS domain S-box-containing protein